MVTRTRRRASSDAFYNVCQHRGRRLVDAAVRPVRTGSCCPYHAWSYRLDGSVRTVFDREVFPADLDRPPDTHPAGARRHVGRSGVGSASTRRRPRCTSYLGVVPDHLACYPLERFALVDDQTVRGTATGRWPWTPSTRATTPSARTRRCCRTWPTPTCRSTATGGTPGSTCPGERRRHGSGTGSDPTPRRPSSSPPTASTSATSTAPRTTPTSSSSGASGKPGGQAGLSPSTRSSRTSSATCTRTRSSRTSRSHCRRNGACSPATVRTRPTRTRMLFDAQSFAWVPRGRALAAAPGRRVGQGADFPLTPRLLGAGRPQRAGRASRAWLERLRRLGARRPRAAHPPLPPHPRPVHGGRERRPTETVDLDSTSSISTTSSWWRSRPSDPLPRLHAGQRRRGVRRTDHAAHLVEHVGAGRSRRRGATALVRVGAFDVDEFDPDQQEMVGVFYGYIYLNLSVQRVFGVRMPGASADIIDASFFGGGADEVPPYRSRSRDESPEHTARITQTIGWCTRRRCAPRARRAAGHGAGPARPQRPGLQGDERPGAVPLRRAAAHHPPAAS